jgi:hypothetical protein
MLQSLKLLKDGWYLEKNGAFEKLDLEDVYSVEFVERLNSHTFKAKSDYSNEIFFYYYVEYKELEYSLSDVFKASASLFSKNTKRSILLALGRSVGFRVRRFQQIAFFFTCFLSFTISLFASLGLALIFPLVLLTRQNFHPGIALDKVKLAKNIFFVRSKAGYSKAKAFILEKERSLELWDDYLSSGGSGYSVYFLLRSSRFFAVYFKSIAFTIRDIFLLFKDARRFLGSRFGFSIFSDYWKRIPHKALYEACVNEILKLNEESAEFYSGEKEDRFAQLQTRCCSKAGKHLNCLPHGLEYGFKFPGGLCGDRFYCFSDKARKTLNSIYSSDKFFFSDEIVNEMLGIKSEEAGVSIARTCFFTEPRDQEVNFEIINVLNDLGVEFSLKLHPLESLDTYQLKFPNISVIQDLSDALKSSVCLARKSTVLIEAAQRGSIAVAVLMNRKDRFYADHLFPSLSSEKISKAYSLAELRKYLLAN